MHWNVVSFKDLCADLKSMLSSKSEDEVNINFLDTIAGQDIFITIIITIELRIAR